MDSKWKIFKVVILCILMARPAFAIKILRPGDVVKGKIATETFYCLNEQENIEILNRLAMVDALKTMIALKEQQIDNLNESVRLMELKVQGREELRDVMQAAYDKSRQRENELAKEVIKVEAELGREKRRRKRIFGGGVLSGIGFVRLVVEAFK